MINYNQFKLKTTQDFIQKRVNIESYLESTDYPHPLAPDTTKKALKNWTPTAVAAMVGNLIRSNLP